MGDINIQSIREDKDLKAVFYHDKCDKYDYLIAAGCGVIAGLVDIFLVLPKPFAEALCKKLQSSAVDTDRIRHFRRHSFPSATFGSYFTLKNLYTLINLITSLKVSIRSWNSCFPP